MKLINVENKYYATTNGDLDWVWQETAGRSGFEGADIDELLSRFAVLLNDGEEGLELGLFDSDDKGRATLFEEAARGTDDGEFVAGLDQLIRDAALVAVMDDADGEFHGWRLSSLFCVLVGKW